MGSDVEGEPVQPPGKARRGRLRGTWSKIPPRGLSPGLLNPEAEQSLPGIAVPERN